MERVMDYGEFVNGMSVSNVADNTSLQDRVNNIITKEGIGMDITSRIADAMTQVNGATVNIGGAEYMPKFKSNFAGIDIQEPAPSKYQATTAMPKGKAWYENHIVSASIPSNIPVDHSCRSDVSGFSTIDLSMVTDDAVNQRLNFLPLVPEDGKDGRLVAMRTWARREDDDNRIMFVLEICMPVMINGGYCFTNTGDVAFTSHFYNVWGFNDRAGNLRPSVMGLLKSSQRYLGKIQATTKDGVGMTRKDDDGTEKPIMVAHYADSLYHDYDILINAQQYAQIMSFVLKKAKLHLGIQG